MAGLSALPTKLLQSLSEYLGLELTWRLGGTCRSLWRFVLFDYQPLTLHFPPRLLNHIRYSPARSGGRSNLFFSDRCLFGHWLARVLYRLQHLRYQKSYQGSQAWRVTYLSLVSGDATATQTADNEVQEDVDSYLSLGDLSIMLIASRKSLRTLDVTCNYDPGAPSRAWLGMPPVRDCDWYIICPTAFPPLPPPAKPPFFEAVSPDLVIKDPRVPGRQQCSLANPLPGHRASDDYDHLICCRDLERLYYTTGQSLDNNLRLPPNRKHMSISSIAQPSQRPHLAFPQLETLVLRPPLDALYSQNCWPLVCLLRLLRVGSFPNLRELRILGDFLVIRQTGAEVGTAQVKQQTTRVRNFATPFEDSLLWDHDVINLYYNGEIPVRQRPNFPARRFLTFANPHAYVDQQMYWRKVFDDSNLWAPDKLPKLEHVAITGHHEERFGDWSKLVLQNCLSNGRNIHTLEFDRTVKSPLEALGLPVDAHVMNSRRWPSLRRVIVRCVYGTETLATVQRLFSVLLGRPVVAQTTHLVLTDESDFEKEAHRLRKWGDFQSRRHSTVSQLAASRIVRSTEKTIDQPITDSLPIPANRNQPRLSLQTFNAKGILDAQKTAQISSQTMDDGFFVPTRPKKLRFRLLSNNDPCDSEEVEEKLRELACLKEGAGADTLSEARKMAIANSYLFRIGETRGTMSEFDVAAGLDYLDSVSGR